MTIRGETQRGFTLVELLVTIALFSILAAGFYQVMFSQVDATETTRSVAGVSQEARLGFNRMVRDTREGSLLTSGTQCSSSEMMAGECYRVRVDFDGDGAFTNSVTQFEDVLYEYHASDETVTICDATACDGPEDRAVLMEGVTPLSGGGIFEFSSNLLRYDTNPSDGITTWQELDAAPGEVGNGNGVLDVGEFDYLSSVTFALQVDVEGQTSEFFTHAQLRNRRFGFE
jgi:prepilin-type N-terminal cleavage/methylation domain-containing protein